MDPPDKSCAACLSTDKEPELAHQPLDGATCHRNAFAAELTPDLLGAIDLVVGLPDALHLRQQLCIALGSQRAQGRLR